MVSVGPSINKPKFSSKSSILVISSLSSFEVNPFLALTGTLLLILLSNLSMSYEAALVANLRKLP